MTKHVLLASRLERIWGIIGFEPFHIGNHTSCIYLGSTSRHASLDVYFELDGTPRVFWFIEKGGEPWLQWSRGYGHVRHSEAYFHKLFHNYWLPSFRQCVWLSGAPIEASAHEKAEWMRGFTREEIQQWELKF